MAITSVTTGSKLILFLGADWWGSDARAMASALRQEGHCLIEVKYEDFFPQQWSSFPLKVLRRFIRSFCATNYNATVRRYLSHPGLDFVLVFKGMLLAPETLALFREKKIPCYCFYPDVGFKAHGLNIMATMPQYDCVFTTKEFHLRDAKFRATIRQLKLVRHGFDPAVHRPVDLGGAARAYYDCDVAFVGCWSPKKENLVAVLLRSFPDCSVRLWGPGWGRAEALVRRCWAGRGAYGDELAAIISCARINLGLLSEAAIDSISGDQTTARTWLIPATGGFMLHEATDELAQYLIPGKEVATFKNLVDLSRKVQYYLAHPKERGELAAAGRRRCLAESYTYAAAVETICAHHAARHG
jgi:spore maturation protein CgeB